MIPAEVILKTNKGYKELHKEFPSYKDAESWIYAMAENPNFKQGGCKILGIMCWNPKEK